MRVNTEELIRQSKQLGRLSRRIDETHKSILRIAKNLGNESVGEKFQYSLRAISDSVERRSEELRMMVSALEMIAGLYDRTENRIADEAEHAVVHHEQLPTGLVNIPSVNGVVANNPGRSSENIDAFSCAFGQDASIIDWTPWNL